MILLTRGLMDHRGRTLLAGAIAGGFLLTACEHHAVAPLPQGPVSLTLTAGNNQTDTIDALLAQTLTVHLGSTTANTAHGVVEFIGIGTSVATTAQGPFATVTSDSTDSTGSASIHVMLGEHTGHVQVIVLAPAFSLADTAVFTVNPGAAASVTVSPADTTIYLQTAARLRPAVLDRVGNVRPDIPHIVLGSGPGSDIDGGDTVYSTGYGIINVLVYFPGFPLAAATIESVPHGRLAAGDWGTNIAMFDLDGSNQVVLQIPRAGSLNQAGTLKWAPSGANLVFDQTALTTCADGSSGLFTLTPSGTVQTIDNSSSFADQWPQYSRDGSWIYYSKIANPGGTGALWRVHPDGTADDSLNNAMPDLDVWPSPSPDGTQVAYIADRLQGPDLRILTVSTGAVTSLGIAAWSPEWSPTTSQVAYLTTVGCSGAISVVNSDGTGGQVLTTTHYWLSFDWSPDGAWLAAANMETGNIDLIKADGSVTIPLNFTHNIAPIQVQSVGLVSPTWLPTVPQSANHVQSRRRRVRK